MAEQNQETVNAEESKQIKYTLFGGAIGYESPSDLGKFIMSIDRNQALHMLVTAVNFAQDKSVYNHMEATIIAAAVKAFLPKEPNPIVNNTNPENEPSN